MTEGDLNAAPAHQPPVAVIGAVPSRPRWWQVMLEVLRHDVVAALAAILLGVVVLAAILGPSLVGPGTTDMDLSRRNLPPTFGDGSVAHVFGTDPLGRDLLGRIVLAARVSLGIAGAVVAVSVVIGALMGTLAGYFGGTWDDIVMRIVDVFMGFPSLLLVIVIIYAIGPGIENLALVLIATRWMLYTRVTRADVLKLRQFEYVEAARSMGASTARIMLRHIVPNLAPTLVTLAILEVSAVILAEAGLSFIGLGVPENSWGRLIADGQKYISSAWWLVSFPGLAILVTTMSLAILANWIVVFLDPSQRVRVSARLQARKV
jgi:peptide/nickel transport system permease protein